MGELMTEGKRVDIVTLAEQLQRNKELSAIGGVAWLAGLPRVYRGGSRSKNMCASSRTSLFCGKPSRRATG